MFLYTVNTPTNWRGRPLVDGCRTLSNLHEWRGADASGSSVTPLLIKMRQHGRSEAKYVSTVRIELGRDCQNGAGGRRTADQYSRVGGRWRELAFICANEDQDEETRTTRAHARWTVELAVVVVVVVVAVVVVAVVVVAVVVVVSG